MNFKKYRARNRKRIVEYLLGHPCVDCGEEDVRVLDFDHIHESKAFNISEFVGRGGSWQRIEAEIAKCVVRCANCHRRKTTVDFGWYKGLGHGV